MHGSTISSTAVSPSEANLRMGYIWIIAFVAALGGLLFGYDWVVIGGAKPFYEAYFHLTSAAESGWANSCALVGCFIGSLCAGRLSDRIGRRPGLILSASLFAISSAMTGWSFSFASFISWRIVGGTAIGLASSISPLYIAEISPAQWRGRLVSLNQLALVIGILAAQIANWRIAHNVPDKATVAMIAASWNATTGWRWMFTAVAVPSLLLLFTAPFIPESPRWLMAHGREVDAAEILTKIGGPSYSAQELSAIRRSLHHSEKSAFLPALRSSSMRRILLVGIGLAVLQQGSGINVLFNYAEDVYRSAGYGVSDVLFNIVITGTINLLFTLVAMFTVDRFGRRALMLAGCIGVGIAHIAASLAFRAGVKGTLVLVFTLAAIACYAASLAPVTWVLISEIFPNRIRAAAMSVTVATLWIASFVLTYTFPLLNMAFGTAGTFLAYGIFCLIGAVFVHFGVPETKGRSLEAIELLEERQ